MPFELIYASRVAPGFDPRFIPDMVRRSRVKNSGLGITGLLVFDGDRFCQLLEGDRAAVLALAATIGQDTRHLQFEVLIQQERDAPRRFEGWYMAYGLYEGEGLGELVGQSSGGQVADYLEGMIPGLAEFSADSAPSDP